MNRKEASFILANIDRRVCDDELNEALDMAIKALEQEPCEESEEVPCDNCKYLDGDGCRLVFEQIEYGKASDECPNDNNVSTKNTVSRETFEQIMWERDIAISQLKELGYGFGEKIKPCGNAIDRAEAIKVASGYCHPANVAKELAKLPSVNPQPCEDAISRQAVFDALDNHKYSNEFCEKHHIDWSINLSMAHIAVNDLPPATPRQKYGKWIKQTLSVKPFGEDTVLCDQCAFMTDKDSMYNYCPNCGARMVEPQESEE